MSTTRMRLGALVSAGVLGLGLSACGGEDEAAESSDTSTVAAEDAQDGEDEATEEPDAAAETEDADAAEDTAEDDAQAGGEGEEFPIDEFLSMVQEPGEETLSSYTMTMAMDADGESIDASGAVDLSGDEPAMNLTMTMAQLGEVEMVTVGGEIFMAVPGVTPEGQYMRTPEDMMGGASAMGDLDVSSQWDAWEEGAEEVRFLGDEDVDGTELGHYRITVDAAAAAESMGEDASAMGVETVVYDVWLDSDNLMRMLSFDMEGVVAEMTMDNWGEAQEIEAPADDQVVDMDEMMDTGGGNG